MNKREALEIRRLELDGLRELLNTVLGRYEEHLNYEEHKVETAERMLNLRWAQLDEWRKERDRREEGEEQ